MSSIFQKIRLGDHTLKVGSGATPRGGKEVYKTSGISLIRSQNVYNNSFSLPGLVFIDEEQAKKLKNVIVDENDILLNITGDSVARVCQVPSEILPARVNQHVAIIRPNPAEIDPTFLRYFLVSSQMQNHMLALSSSGATRKALTKGMIENLVVPAPPIKEQRAIAAVLGAFDDKIELNRQMNATLEEMARAIFKSWFVDFDPVRAKARGEEPYGMDAETAALFPDRFEVVNGREVPEGWQVKPVSKAFEINPPRKLTKGEPAPYLAMANAPTASARATTWKIRNFGSGMRFTNGDALLARITPCLENGKSLFVDFLEDNEIGWGSTEYLVFRSKPPLPLEFAYILMRVENFRQFAITNMTGTSGRQRVPKQAFDNYPIVIPSEAIASKYGDFVGKVFSKMKANDDESRIMAELRDTLLPRLMSGQVRIPMEEKPNS